MREIGSILDAIQGGSDVICRILKLACLDLDGGACGLIVVHRQTVRVIAGYNLDFGGSADFVSPVLAEKIAKSRISCLDKSHQGGNDKVILDFIRSDVEKIIFFRIPPVHPDIQISVALGLKKEKFFQIGGSSELKFNALTDVIKDEIDLLSDASKATIDISELKAKIFDIERQSALSGGEYNAGGDPVTNFLKETLVHRHALRSRGDITYYTLNQWRTPIKSHQISALKSLKRSFSRNAVNLASDDICGWVNKVFGRPIFDTVVSVPCGHSGEDCFSRQISIEVASKLNLNQIDAFDPIPSKGSSHPKKNLSRVGMTCKSIIQGNILLIDDVATSGHHIHEAATKLRAMGNSVTAVSWIGGG